MLSTTETTKFLNLLTTQPSLTPQNSLTSTFDSIILSDGSQAGISDQVPLYDIESRDPTRLVNHANTPLLYTIAQPDLRQNLRYPVPRNPLSGVSGTPYIEAGFSAFNYNIPRTTAEGLGVCRYHLDPLVTSASLSTTVRQQTRDLPAARTPRPRKRPSRVTIQR